MWRVTRFIGVTIVLLLCLSLLALAGSEDRVIGKQSHLTVYSKVYAGSVLLEPGEYQIQHVSEGEAHFVVFEKNRGRHEVARVACLVEPLTEKAKETALVSSEGKLIAVRIKGENVTHSFED